MRFVSFMVVSYAAALFVAMHDSAPSPHKRLLKTKPHSFLTLSQSDSGLNFLEGIPPISHFGVSFNFSLVYIGVQRGMTMD